MYKEGFLFNFAFLIFLEYFQERGEMTSFMAIFAVLRDHTIQNRMGFTIGPMQHMK